MTFRPLCFLTVALGALAFAAGCGGGSLVAPTPSVPSSTSIPFSTTTAQPATVMAGAVTATLVFPPTTGATGGTISVTGSATQPGGTVPLMKEREDLPTGATALAFLSVTASSTVTLSAVPSFSFVLPANVATTGVGFYVALLQPGGTSWSEPALGPATVTGQTLSFGLPQGTLTLNGASTFYFALYSTPGTPTSAPTAGPSSSPSGSPSPGPSGSPTGSPSGSPSPLPSPSGLVYMLGGSTAVITLSVTATPSPAVLSNYQNIAVTVQFAVPNAGGTFDLSDATGNGDIMPSGFPVDNANSGYTPVIYISVLNTGGDISFGGNVPSIQVTKSTGFGTMMTCNLDVYSNGGSGSAWQSPVVGATIVGMNVTLGPATLVGSTVDFQTGQQLIAVSCH
jgi:hypothetical protein